MLPQESLERRAISRRFRPRDVGDRFVLLDTGRTFPGRHEVVLLPGGRPGADPGLRRLDGPVLVALARSSATTLDPDEMDRQRLRGTGLGEVEDRSPMIRVFLPPDHGRVGRDP